MLDVKDLGGFLTNEFGDRYLHQVNGFAFDKIGSAGVFQNVYKDEIFQENFLYIFLGTDSGLLPKYLQAKGVPKGTRYLFIELDHVLERVVAELEDGEPAEKIVLATLETWVAKASDIEFQNYVYLNQVRILRSVAAEDALLPEYHDLVKDVQEEYGKLQWALTAELGHEIFTLRQLENLGENRHSALKLRGGFEGKCAIIMGGGPSLDDVLPWVRANRDRIVVIAVSRIARRLLDIDVVPDVFVSIDPHSISFDISKEMLRFGERTVFVHMHHAVNTLVGQWSGRNLFAGTRIPWISPHNEELMDVGGPTVTNCAIDLAIEMGFSQILLAGVDLCFSKSGHTHAKGSNEALAGPQLALGQLWVETNGGWKAETTADLHFAIGMIEVQATRARAREVDIINLGEGAARIPGVEFRRAADISFEPLEKPAHELIAEHLPADGPLERIAFYTQMLAELRRGREAFARVEELAEEALKANRAFFGHGDEKRGDPRLGARIDLLQKRLQEDFPDFSSLLKKFGIRGFLRLTQGEQGDDMAEAEVERLGHVFFESYRDSARRLGEIVDQAVSRIETRLEEEQSAPDFARLFAQWRNDAQQGRAHLWRLRHAEARLCREVEDSFKELEEEFEQALRDQETLHLKRSRAWSQLTPVRGKLQLMFSRRQRDALEEMLGRLTAADGDEAENLLRLGRGYLAELNGAGTEALEHYHALIDQLAQDQKSPLLEEALKRVLSISLGESQVENSLLALECLSGISAIYLPYYADVLRLVGEHHRALDAYAGYLEKSPEDTAVMLKLARYYLELDHREGAKFMLETVLNQDSENQAARSLMRRLETSS